MSVSHKLTLVPYLQRWDHGQRVLSIRLLVAPTSDPLAPLWPTPPGVPAFADARLAFSIRVSDAAVALPQRTLVDQTVVLPDPGGSSPTIHRPNARAIFSAIKAALEIPDTPAADTFAPQSRDMTVQLRKFLPGSYRRAFAFTQPRTPLAVTDDTYHCLMNCPPDPVVPPPPTVIGWGEALAFAMRRPRLAEALGLVHALEIPLDPVPRLEQGGWLWVELAPASDYSALQASIPGFVRSFATRVPALPLAEARAVFTPVVFPVFDDAAAAATAGNFDKVFTEAVRFDDGFSKIVHARQPVSADLLDEEGTGAPIARDEGIQLGWDDEDILEGQNRALGAPPPGEDPVLAPRGVLGYRVDVRSPGDPEWTSLSLVRAPLSVGVDLGTALEERWSEVVPTQHGTQIWLPAWFVRWRGGSLVVATNDEQRLMGVPPGRPVLDEPVDDDRVELRYGRSYELRVRLADTTGGGPDLDAEPAQPGESPVATLAFRRRRPPGIVEVGPLATNAEGTVISVRARRPRLGYPEAVFAAGPSARTSLLAQIAANDAATDPAMVEAPFIRDPDVAFLRVRVRVRAPTFDPAADAEGYLDWYETSRAFPSDPDVPLELALAWQSAADYRDIDVSAQLGPEGTVTGPVLVPTARDVRLELRAVGRDDLSYFASADARMGRSDEVDLHAIAPTAAELDALATLPPSDALRSVFLRPDPVGERAPARAVAVQNAPSPALLERLAAAVELVADDTLLVSQEGERVAFGCSGLAHHLAPDATSIEVSEPAELAEQWINVVQAVLRRDWTWRGAGSPSLRVTRSVTLLDAPGAVVDEREVGTIELMPTINVQAAKNPERGYVRLVLVDAMPPPLGPDGLPYEAEVKYRLELALEGGGVVEQSVSTRLPIVTPPRQVPRVVAAGLALTPYAHDAEYASTASRIKRLWIELAEPLEDPRDAWFVRPLARTPDPMLLPGVEPVADPALVETIPLDPELVRVITPGQVQDLAGLAAMQRLEPSTNGDNRYLVPLPPNTDPNSPELFSFFTYELRAGHDRGPAADPLWVTAQGRFGEPLVLEGVQHPPPELVCSAFAEPEGAIRVRAPFATPYVGLRNVLPEQPNTEIWVVLYARVVQADGSTRRNVQIALRRAQVPRRAEASAPLARQAEAYWWGGEVREALRLAGLPEDLPISALAVEVLPEPNGSFADPLGGDLGQVRILRTSPLTAVERDCCVP
jgi:hypothetical protein